MTSLDEYYNKFNEDKRLDSRHGRVEFIITMKYIHDFLKPGDKILEVGAGTGRYSITLFNEGYDVTAVEPVQHNLGRLKQKCPEIKAFKGNALKLKRLPDDEFDLTLLFGPMYHLIGREDKLKALLEAKRVTKPGGIIMAAYIMNEYSVLTYAFKEQHVLECLAEGKLDKEFKTVAGGEDLYDYVRTEDIDRLAKEAGLSRIKIFSPDGPANHMRQFLNRLSEEEFARFIDYQMAVCERADLLGASAHTVDILKK
ncbi:MAG: class I SAM-dependent methyltransferase [Lachnospiraceae bacterium]|nr:class I SAM-dependent methyltransferase [Lachnospiraceae bacterium]